MDLSYTVFFDEYITYQQKKTDGMEEIFSHEITKRDETEIGGGKLLTHYQVLRNDVLIVFSVVNPLDQPLEPFDEMKNELSSIPYTTLKTRHEQGTLDFFNVRARESVDNALERNMRR